MVKPPLGNRKLIRDLNRSTVLNTILSRGPISRAALAQFIGLSPASITNLTAELLEQGLILETKHGESSGGRRPILLEINPNGGFVIGLKLTEEQIIGALTDLSAEVLSNQTTPLAGTEPGQIVEKVGVSVTDLLRKAKVSRKKLRGVGVGMAGVVDAERGISRQHPFFGWRDVPLGGMLRDRLGTLVHIDNDVNALTLAELLYGAGQGANDFLTVTIGRGVGLGIVVGGKLYRGARGGGGEFGHIVVEPNGPLCNCGKRGCLEAFVGERALLREAQEAADRGEIPPIETIEDLISAGTSGDVTVKQIFSNAGRILGREVANLVNVFNPELILISGEGTRIGDLIFQAMYSSIDEYAMPTLKNDTEVRIDPWGDDAWAVGAASLVLREFFASPIHRRTAAVLA
jgi:predicted NBD/HSP70 family sugar kinase